MNSQRPAATVTNRSALLVAASGLLLLLLLLLVAAPREVSSFATTVRSRASFSVGDHGVTTRRTASSRTITASTTTATAKTRLSGHLAYLDSLNSITENPHLFPTTSDYIHTLSQLNTPGSVDAAITDAPSAEEFLTQLSTELLRASREYDLEFPPVQQAAAAASATATAAVETAASTTTTTSPLYTFAEQTIPAFTSAAAVSAAAESYIPGSYSPITQTMADNSVRYNYNNNNDVTAAGGGYATDYAAAAGNSGYGDFETLTHQSTAAATAVVNEVSNNGGGGGTPPSPPESFAAWHSQGGSNSLRDLASKIPTVEQTDISYAAADNSGAGMNDYFGNAGYYLVDNADQVGQQSAVAAAPAWQDAVPTAGDGGFDASTVANSFASSNLELGDISAAAAITDNGVDGATASASDHLAAIVDTVPITDGGAAIPEVDNEQLSNAIASQLSDLKLDELQIDGDTVATIAFADTAPSSSTSPLLSDYIKGQLDHFEFPQYHLELPEVLSNPRDYIKDQFNHFDFPQYHLELPDVLSKPLSENMDWSPPSSVQNALSSVKEALPGASKEKWESIFSSMSHSMDGLGDKVADVTNSLEGLSGQVGKVADAGISGVKAIGNAAQSSASSVGEGIASVKSVSAGIGNAVQSGAATVGGGLSGMGSSVKSVGAGMAGAAASVKTSVGDGLQPPNLNIEAPTLPDVNIQPPELPSVNFPHPTLPEVNLPSMNIQPPAMPNLNIMEGTNVGEASLSDLGNGIISAVKFTGGIIIKFLDFILNAVAGTSVSSILTNVQTSVTSVIDNAVHAVVSTITNIGNMSVIEIIQHLMALVIAITDILLKILNAIVYLISGRDGAEWALQATSSVNEASSQLLAQATSTYDDVTHESLRELAHTIGDYSHYVGNEFVTLMTAVPLDHDTLGSATTAVQTALTSGLTL